jgi:hypothetical protein
VRTAQILNVLKEGLRKTCRAKKEDVRGSRIKLKRMIQVEYIVSKVKLKNLYIVIGKPESKRERRQR